MDNIKYKQNMAVLKEIEQNVPKRLSKNLLKKVVNTEQEDTVRILIKDPLLSLEMKKKMTRELKNGDFKIVEEVENEKILKELDAYYEREVKKAIKDGRLSSPDEDPFYQKIAKRWDKNQNENNL